MHANGQQGADAAPRPETSRGPSAHERTSLRISQLFTLPKKFSHKQTARARVCSCHDPTAECAHSESTPNLLHLGLPSFVRKRLRGPLGCVARL